jgi:hypothetical protein
MPLAQSRAGGILITRSAGMINIADLSGDEPYLGDP